MVRLKASRLDKYKSVQTKFQFQNGTIKRGTLTVSTISDAMFQFQNGTIKSTGRVNDLKAILVVSIPKWYD